MGGVTINAAIVSRHPGGFNACGRIHACGRIQCLCWNLGMER